MSEQIDLLAASLVKAQAMIDKATKDRTNPHFKSKYADLESVIDAVKPALAVNDLAFIQKFHDCDNGVKIETILIHKSGQTLSCGILMIPASKHDAQGFGSAASYAKRYGLQAALGVASSDDDGNAAVQTAPKPVNISNILMQLSEANTEDELKKVFATAWASAPNQQAKDEIKFAYDTNKARFQGVK